MTPKNLTISFLLTLLIAVPGLSGMASAQDTARIRFVHAAADGPALDLYINGELAAADLVAGATSSPLPIAVGALDLAVHLAGTQAQLYSDALHLEVDSALILSAEDPAPIALLAEDLRPLEFGMTRLLVLNALEGGGAMNISAADGSFTAENVAHGAAAGPFVLPAGAIELAIAWADAAGNMSRLDAGAALSAGTSQILVIQGSLDDPQLLNSAAAVDGASESGTIRFLHAAQGAAAFDIELDDKVIVPSLAFGDHTEPLPLPSGIREIAVSLGSFAVMTDQLHIEPGQRQTILLIGSPSTLSLAAFDDGAMELDESSAGVRLINTIPHSVVNHLKLESGAIVALNVAYGEAGGAAQIVPSRQSMTLTLDIGDARGVINSPAKQFFPGVYYDLVAVPGSAFSAPRILAAETNPRRQIPATMPATESLGEPDLSASAPLAAEADASADAEVVPQETMPAESADTADAPTEIQPLTDDEPMAEQDSSGESAAASDSETADGEIAEVMPVGPFAIVAVDSGSGLHLRQYPTSEALSLAVLPAEANLTVLGRRGPSVLIADEPANELVDLSGYTVDPAAALYPIEDLPPADTWLFAMYSTPDGGAIQGWVNALYLRVYDAHSERQRLASLPLMRQNQPGKAYNTTMRPPALADSISARVVNLDEAALLNIRMANNATSQVLGQLAPGTTVGFIGMNADNTWAFVSHETDAGTVIKGWVSARYIQPLLNDQPVDFDTLRALDVTAAKRLSDDVRGSTAIALRSDAVEPSTPLRGIVGEVDINADAALHLRRQAHARTASLALIPARALLPLQGVTASGDWFKTSYDGEEGWVAAMYIVLTKDGRYYHREFLKSQLPVHDDFSSAED